MAVKEFLSSLAPVRGHFVYLASKSPRRRELLRQIGVEYRVIEGEVDETQAVGEGPQAMVRRLAREKARAGFSRVIREGFEMAPVLGADTCVVLDGDILGKPRDRSHGLAMLASLTGRSHFVMTGVAMATDTAIYDAVSVSTVHIAPLSARDIDLYWDSGEPADKAGAYGVQGLGGAFVSSIEGSYSGVVGLPLYEFVSLLNRARGAVDE